MKQKDTEIQEVVNTILTDEVLDHLDEITETCAQRDRDCLPFPKELLRTHQSTQILRASIPKEHGGLGLNPEQWGRILEEVGRQCDDASYGLLISMFPAVANTIFNSKNDELKKQYARGILDGSRLISFAYTEATDAFNFQSKMTIREDRLEVSGEKMMITGGAIADAFMTYVASTENDELYVLIIDKNDPGVEVEPLQTMGLRSVGFAKLKMNSVKLPKTRLLVPNGGGLTHAQDFLNPRRVILSSSALGRIARTINHTTEYVNRIIRYDAPLSSYTSVQNKLGEMRIAYESAKVMVRNSLGVLKDNQSGEYLQQDDGSNATKHRCAEAGLLVTQKAFELMGGMAYCWPNPVERYVRDGFGSIAGAGTQDILKINTGVKTLFDQI